MDILFDAIVEISFTTIHFFSTKWLHRIAQESVTLRLKNAPGISIPTGRDLNHSASYDEYALSIPLFHITSLNRQSRCKLNMPLLITERDAGDLRYATYEDGTLDFSGLRKRSQYGSAFHTSDRLPLLSAYC